MASAFEKVMTYLNESLHLGAGTFHSGLSVASGTDWEQ